METMTLDTTPIESPDADLLIEEIYESIEPTPDVEPVSERQTAAGSVAAQACVDCSACPAAAFCPLLLLRPNQTPTDEIRDELDEELFYTDSDQEAENVEDSEMKSEIKIESGSKPKPHKPDTQPTKILTAQDIKKNDTFQPTDEGQKYRQVFEQLKEETKQQVEPQAMAHTQPIVDSQPEAPTQDQPEPLVEPVVSTDANVLTSEITERPVVNERTSSHVDQALTEPKSSYRESTNIVPSSAEPQLAAETRHQSKEGNSIKNNDVDKTVTDSTPVYKDELNVTRHDDEPVVLQAIDQPIVTRTHDEGETIAIEASCPTIEEIANTNVLDLEVFVPEGLGVADPESILFETTQLIVRSDDAAEGRAFVVQAAVESEPDIEREADSVSEELANSYHFAALDPDTQIEELVSGMCVEEPELFDDAQEDVVAMIETILRKESVSRVAHVTSDKTKVLSRKPRGNDKSISVRRIKSASSGGGTWVKQIDDAVHAAFGRMVLFTLSFF